MIQMELSSEEAQVLRDVLNAVISNLGMEIADTDQKDYRDVIKERKQMLLKMVGSLQ